MQHILNKDLISITLLKVKAWIFGLAGGMIITVMLQIAIQLLKQ